MAGEGLTTGSVPFIQFTTTPVFGVSTTIFLDSYSQLTVSVSNVSVFLGTAALVGASSPEILVSVSSVDAVNTTNVPIVPVVPVILPADFFSDNLSFNYTVEQTVGVSDTNITPVLVELNNVNNDVTKLSTYSKNTWIETVLVNNSTFLNKNIINILTNNYQKFAIPTRRLASKFAINRRSY